MRLLNHLATLLAIASPPLLACSSLADPDYQGEPLASLHGTVTMQTEDTPELKVLLQWTRGHFSCPFETPDCFRDLPLEDQLLLSEAPVTGELPASFTFDLFEPPPDYALVTWNSGDVDGDPGLMSFAFIQVVPADLTSADFVESGFEDENGRPYYQISEDDIHGVSREQMLVYLARDLDPEGDVARFLVHAPLTAGYHLLDIRPVGAEERAARRACLDKAFPGRPLDSFYESWFEGGPGLAELAQCGGDPELDELHLASADLDSPISITIEEDPFYPRLPIIN